MSSLADWKERDQRKFYTQSEAAARDGGRIYMLARRRPDIKDQKGQPIWPDIAHFRYPDGPNGPAPAYHVTYSTAIMKQSKQQQAVRELVKWLHSKEQYAKWFEHEGGYTTGANAFWKGNPMWSQVGEAMRSFKTASRGSRALA